MASPFITLEEMKQYLSITTTEHDLKLKVSIDSVSAYITEYTGVTPKTYSADNDPQLRRVAFQLVEIDFLSVGGKYIGENGVVYDITHAGMPSGLREILNNFARVNTVETTEETVFTL